MSSSHIPMRKRYAVPAIPEIGFLRQCLLLLTLSLIMVLTACGGGDGGTQGGEQGELIIGLTDAPGDFQSYTVDVTQISLTKANGAIVEVLPLNTRVDFAQYTQMTEFLTATMIPAGVYTAASLSLDYSNADIWVEGADGDAVKVQQFVDEAGNAITHLQASVRLEGRHSLLIAPGLPSHMTLDFDLKASNVVEFDAAGVPVQTVSPVLLADVELQQPKIHRLRGPLSRVSVARQQFDIILRPFFHPAQNDRRFGQMRVNTDKDTVFDIDNQQYRGNAGLEALAAMPSFSATIAIGELRRAPRRFVATEVYAGSSVPGGSLDVVSGTVVARDGNTLSVRGASLIRAGGSVVFKARARVELADTTKVFKQLSDQEHTIADVSVGQRVLVFGSITLDSANELVLDAGNGVLRMRMSSVSGTRLAVDGIPEVEPPLVLDLQRMNLWPVVPGRFDFSGTAMAPANDADPGFYEINTGVLDVSAIAMGAPVRALGFVSPFGSAPADFDAVSVVDLSEVSAVMNVSWLPARADAFTVGVDRQLVLNMEGVGLFHHVARAGTAVDLAQAGGSPVLASPHLKGIYVIEQTGSRQLYTDYAGFVSGLEQRLQQGALVKRLLANGYYTDDSADFSARDIWVRLF